MENENNYTEERIHKEHKKHEYVTLRKIITEINSSSKQAREIEVPEDTTTIDLSNQRPKLPKRVKFALTRTNNLQGLGYAL